MPDLAFQDVYPPDVAQCFGCGHLNPHGHHLRTFWDGEETVTRFTPRPEHTAIPGYVYGGLLASVIDCHSTGSGAGALARARGLVLGKDPIPRCVTGSLEVRYLEPTPLGPELVVRGHIDEIKGRKVVVSSTLYAGEVACVRGRAVVLELPEGAFGR
ncbi:MAG: PaaI family thioesterase [Pseudomonadota bacterium]